MHPSANSLQQFFNRRKKINEELAIYVSPLGPTQVLSGPKYSWMLLKRNLWSKSEQIGE